MWLGGKIGLRHINIMRPYFSIRGIAVVLIAVSLFLPLSRCERKPIVLNGEDHSSAEFAAPVHYSYTYAKDWFQLSDWTGWVAMLSFAWPLILLILVWQSPKEREHRALPWVEILLCMGSFFVIWNLSSFGERRYGAYLALAGLVIYLLGAVIEPIGWITVFIRERFGNKTSAQHLERDQKSKASLMKM